MAEIGIMVYGFGREEAGIIKDKLIDINNEEVMLISGCRREEDIISDILDDEGYSEFEEKEDPRVVMFLGFDGPKIHASMDNFPELNGNRPIFCTPTENNSEWKLSALLEDLMEERAYFKQKDKKAKDQG